MRARGEGPRFVGWIAASVATLLACVLAIGDALYRNALHHERSSSAPAIVRIAPPDLALSFSSRWLRHGSQAEPAAAFSDGPSLLDTDSAGAFLAPRRAYLRSDARAWKAIR